MVDGNVLDMEVKVRTTNKTTVHPNKAKEIGDNNLDMGAKYHDMVKATVSLDKTKIKVVNGNVFGVEEAHTTDKSVAPSPPDKTRLFSLQPRA